MRTFSRVKSWNLKKGANFLFCKVPRKTRSPSRLWGETEGHWHSYPIICPLMMFFTRFSVRTCRRIKIGNELLYFCFVPFKKTQRRNFYLIIWHLDDVLFTFIKDSVSSLKQKPRQGRPTNYLFRNDQEHKWAKSYLGFDFFVIFRLLVFSAKLIKDCFW